MRRQDGCIVALCGALLGPNALSGCSGDEREFNGAHPDAVAGMTAEAGEAGAQDPLAGAPGGGSSQVGGGAAGESTGGGRAAAGADADVPDTTAPTIVDVSPADGEIGVSADAELSLTFSEPMDEAVTESAYQSASAGITAASVAFSWNAEATVLTIKPSGALGYAEGTTLANVKARTYAFVLGSAAQDAAGNALKNDVNVEFSTLRRITQQLAASAFPLSGGYVVKGEGESSMTYMDVGCLEANEVFRTFVTFELAELPPDVETFEMASVTFYQSSQSSIDRTPYEALGDLQLLSLAFTTVNRAAFDKLDLSGTVVVGKFSTVAKGNKSVTVTDTLAVDYETRDRSQYGVRFATKLNNDLHHDVVHFEDTTKPNPPVLETTYLVP